MQATGPHVAGLKVVICRWFPDGLPMGTLHENGQFLGGLNKVVGEVRRGASKFLSKAIFENWWSLCCQHEGIRQGREALMRAPYNWDTLITNKISRRSSLESWSQQKRQSFSTPFGGLYTAQGYLQIKIASAHHHMSSWLLDPYNGREGNKAWCWWKCN